jgi:hypothetical protein
LRSLTKVRKQPYDDRRVRLCCVSHHRFFDQRYALDIAEEWLLSTIASRKDTSRPCPATFLQAMGEKEYENSVSSLAGGSRTQLWKPSRSWWEAKSGKNPWIEPTSHNKRWRYVSQA